MQRIFFIILISPLCLGANEVQWTRLLEFSVVDYPEKSTQLQAGVISKGESCEIIREHARFKKDQPWSPLPVLFGRVQGTGEVDGLFAQVLSFSQIKEKENPIQFFAKFKRGRIEFKALWRLISRKVNESCRVEAQICRDLVWNKTTKEYECKEKKSWNHLSQVVARVNVANYLYEAWKKKPETERDDLDSLTLTLDELNGEGFPRENPKDEEIK